MSSKKYAAPLHLEIGSSRLLLMLLFFLHVFAFALLFLMPFHPLLLAACTVFIIASGIYTIGYHAKKKRPSSITGLIWDIVDDWYTLDKQGNKTQVILDGNSYVHSWIAILNFKQQDRWLSKSVILLRDNINQNDFRRLRVRLKVTRPVLDGED